MGERHEPTMEEILASIKKIIAEDGEVRPRTPRADPVPEPPPIEADAEDVLELTEAFEEDSLPVSEKESDPVLSEHAAEAGRAALAALSAIADQPSGEGDHAEVSQALEALVREMLRPMLKEWLDANLPVVVERLVMREIARLRPRDG